MHIPSLIQFSLGSIGFLLAICFAVIGLIKKNKITLRKAGLIFALTLVVLIVFSITEILLTRV
jgi:hypothetical protein